MEYAIIMVSYQLLIISLIVYIGSLASTLILSTVHTYYGSRELRKLSAPDSVTDITASENMRVMHTFLALDSAKILSASIGVIIATFVLFLLDISVHSTQNILFYIFIFFAVISNVLIAVKIGNDLRVNRVSAVRYEMVSSTERRPSLEFVPDVLFKPLRSLITKGIAREGNTKIGVVTSNRKIVSRKKDYLVFDEIIRLRNPENFADHKVKEVIAEDPYVIIANLSPPVPFVVPAQKTVVLNIRCNMRMNRPRGPMLIRISSE